MGGIMRCEYCGQDFQTSRVYSPTAPNRPRFCSSRCRGMAYRRERVQTIDRELEKATAAIERAREVLRAGARERT